MKKWGDRCVEESPMISLNLRNLLVTYDTARCDSSLQLRRICDDFCIIVRKATCGARVFLTT